MEGLDLVTTALYYYNTTHHSTIKTIPQNVHLDNINLERALTEGKEKALKRANKKRKEEDVNENYITRPRVRKLDNTKRIAKKVIKVNDDHYEETWGNNVKNILYKSNFARKKKYT